MSSYIKERNIFAVILLSMFTFGIYPLYLWFAFGSELRAESEQQRTPTQLTSVGVAFLLTLITFGIYGIYYIYQQAKVVKELGDSYGVVVLDPVVICIFTIFIGIGSYLNVYYATQVSQAISRGGNPR